MLIGIVIQGLKPAIATIVMPQKRKTIEVRNMALLADRTLRATQVPSESFTATISGLKDRLMQSLTLKLETKLAAITLQTSRQNNNRQFSGSRFSNNRTHFQSQNNYQYRPRPAYQEACNRSGRLCTGCGGFCIDRVKCPAQGQICYFKGN